MKPGDIYWVDFDDPPQGREISKRRPALVISPEEFNRLTKVPVVLPITTVCNYSREHGFAVSLHGVTTKVSGIIRCDRPTSVDFAARNATYVEAIPNKVLDDILYRTAMLIFPSIMDAD